MTDPDPRIWAEMLAHLKRHTPAITRRWFEELEPLGFSGGIYWVRVQSDVHREYLRRECAAPFGDAARAVTGQLVSIRFIGNDEQPVRDDPADNRRQPDSLVLNPDCTFENFVIGPNNRMAHAAALAVSDNPGRAYNPLFIHGGVGLGKTHLLQAICLRLLHKDPRTVVHFTSCEGFITQFTELVRAGRMNEFRDRFRGVDVLVVDDVHFLAKRDRTQEEFFHTFNSLYQKNKQIVLSSDAPPEDIPQLEERLVSRFKWGLVTQILPPGYETRVEIVKTKAALRNLAIPDDVAFHIAAQIDSNIREIEGGLTRLQMVAVIADRPIDIDMAREAVGDHPKTRGEPGVHAIVRAVTDFYNVRLNDLRSKRRHRSVTHPRQVCMYLLRQHTRRSLEEIGLEFGGRDHTTVMHAIRMVAARRLENPRFDSELEELETKIRSLAT